MKLHPTQPSVHNSRKLRLLSVLGFMLGLSALSGTASADVCPVIYNKGTLNLPFMPAFLQVDKYRNGDGLTVSSFLNANRNTSSGSAIYTRFERDLVARIPKIHKLNYGTFDGNNTATLQILSDVVSPLSPVTVWPNDAEKIPEDIFPAPWNWFEWIIVPQGFLSDSRPGRLSLIQMNGSLSTEYVIHQSTQMPPNSGISQNNPSNSPRNYHKVIWHDMDGDGLKDALTVRSAFKVAGGFYSPYAELVYFKNPGAALLPNIPWQEVILYGSAITNYKAPDIYLDAHDFDDDGQIEIIGTSFFSGPNIDSVGLIQIFGAPVGGTWADVNAETGSLPRVADISSDQGQPFGIQITDLNNDGRMDILATNHQKDGCNKRNPGIPGRVYAIEAPENGDLFNSPWVTHILKDNIRPQPTLAGYAAPGRLAPGRARSFYPVKFLENISKPNIVVGGDEAGKVWVLTPHDQSDPTNWAYDSGVIFDINSYYGANTTQTPYSSGSKAGRTNGTIGALAVRYNNSSAFGSTELFIPAYEAQDIHVLSYQKPAADSTPISCTADVKYACP